MMPFWKAVPEGFLSNPERPDHFYKRWITGGIEFSLELEPILLSQGYRMALYYKKPNWEYFELMIPEKIPVWPMEEGDIYISTAPHHMIFEHLDSTEEESA